MNNYVLEVVKQAREREFMDLIQGAQSISQYKATFSRLIQYSPYIQDDKGRQT